MFIAPHLQSLEVLQRDRVFAGTQRLPVLVRAEDRKYYVTKVQRTPQDYTVVREWLGAHLLKVWELPVPDFAVIQVQAHHVPVGFHPRLTAYEFSRPAFGSLYLTDVDHVNATFSGAGPYQVGLAHADDALIRLSLFDRWLSNDDRNFNNYNLLYRGSGTQAGFFPIDHEALFGHGVPGQPLSPQTANENLSQTPLFATFVKRKRVRAYVADPAELRLFHDLVEACESALPSVIEGMPPAWSALCNGLLEGCRETIFAPSWLDKVWKDHLEQLSLSCRS